MYIRCWGSRGSLPVSGKQFNRYGGETSCLEIRTKRGETIVVDAGTGIRGLGSMFIRTKRTKFHMVFTHAHLDHLMGFPLFAPLHHARTDVIIHGGGFKKLSFAGILGGFMRPPYFPVNLTSVAASLHFENIGEEPFSIGGIVIRPIRLSHPNGGLGFRFEEGASSFVFLTDNEPAFTHPGGHTFDEYSEFCRGADLLIHDAEFTAPEYRMTRSYGHSTYAAAVELGMASGAARLGLFHHNRERTDTQVDAMVAASRKIVKQRKARMDCFAVANTFNVTL
jgi:phosphoribosyl 1,2-cyclic phosphodiesterase